MLKIKNVCCHETRCHEKSFVSPPLVDLLEPWNTKGIYPDYPLMNTPSARRECSFSLYGLYTRDERGGPPRRSESDGPGRAHSCATWSKWRKSASPKSAVTERSASHRASAAWPRK